MHIWPARFGRTATSLALGWLALVGLAGGALAATPAHTLITNTAHAAYSVGGTPMTASSSVAVTTQASVVPVYSLVFDAASGAPLNGARVSKINPLSGLPAAVYCDDGITPLPQPVISGAASVCDAAVPAGGYRFPVTAPGAYQLVISAPAGFDYPSAVLPASLPGLIGLPLVAAVIVGGPGLAAGASYGGTFALAGATQRIDLPLDATSQSVALVKSAGKSVVGVGEFVPYTLRISNNSATGAVRNGLLVDHPPLGFRYQQGSARLDGLVMADPVVAPDTSTLTFTVNLAPAGVANLRYVLEVTPAAPIGTADNSVAASAPLQSNTTRASVLVREDLFHSKAILIGRVIDGACDPVPEAPSQGLANARVVLQDGSYVLTDADGRWHMDNLRAGTHVVQLDRDSLPSDYQVLTCQPNTRFAGRSDSQLVNLRGGTLWQADFYVQKNSVSGSSPSVGPDAVALPPSAATVAPIEPTQLVEQLPFDAAWLAGAPPGLEWLHPQSSFHPNLPVLKVAVKHHPQQQLALLVNGTPVNPLLFESTQINAGHSVALSLWNAVPVQQGPNRLELRVSDAQGKLLSSSVRTIDYAGAPDHIELLAPQSRLLADGKTRPLIAIRVLDKNGVPVRRGLSGEFQLNEPYLAHERQLRIEREPLGDAAGSKPRFTIQNDGIALIELEPSTQSGEAVLTFEFNHQRQQVLRAWLQAGPRDWILVGFAEGTLGHKTISGHATAQQGLDEPPLFDGNKLAFYAKGSIRGDYLLTLAYDSSKATGSPVLKQALDPAQYYTLYGDASQTRYDAASTSRLYVKLERAQFYALFGDYDTGLTVTELARYSRTLNGLKSEYQGAQFGYNAFASISAQAYAKDELPGNGTSGVYRLSRGNLLINTDKIRLETRDRFQSHLILETRPLTRYLDYNLDYQTGALTFREPVQARDANFNPIYIVAEYESADPGDQAATLGARASFKPDTATVLGATLIHEGNLGASGHLQGLDASYQLGPNTSLRGELASSARELAGISASGSAWLGELQHHEAGWDLKAYARQQAPGFGLSQQASAEVGLRKFGLDGRYQLSPSQQLQAQAYQQQNLSTGAQSRVLEGRMKHQLTDALDVYYGARSAQDHGTVLSSQGQQLIAGAAYAVPKQKISLHGAAEIGVAGAGSANLPERVLLGVDYQLTPQSKLFAEQEFARGLQMAANATRMGLRSQVWQGGEVAASVGNTRFNDAARVYGNLGLVQRWRINPQWQTDVSLDRSQSLRNTITATSNSSLPPFGAPPADYTAASWGLAYQRDEWSGNGRIELRTASQEQQHNLQFGLLRRLGAGRSMAAGWSVHQTSNASQSSYASDLRGSYAYRPSASRWVWLDRADLITLSSTSAGASQRSSKLVNNFNANVRPDRHTQLALQYGAKYVTEAIDGTDYTGYTDLLGFELRHDVTKDWDVGVFASVLRSHNAGVRDYNLGVSVGYLLMDNVWLSLGYNLHGLNDRDFNGAGASVRGVYVTLRMKFDQDTLGLNQPHPATFTQPRAATP